MITSREIAKVWNMEHRAILRSINKIVIKNNRTTPLIGHGTYVDSSGRTLPLFVMEDKTQIFYVVGCLAKDTVERCGLWYSLLTQWDDTLSVENNWKSVTDKCQISNNKKTFVYILKSAAGLYKIGISEQPYKRCKTLQKTHGYALEVVNTKECANRKEALATEKYLHSLHAPYRVEGEWFSRLS